MQKGVFIVFGFLWPFSYVLSFSFLLGSLFVRKWPFSLLEGVNNPRKRAIEIYEINPRVKF